MSKYIYVSSNIMYKLDLKHVCKKLIGNDQHPPWGDMYSPNCTFIHFVHSTLHTQHILPTQAGQTVRYIVVYASLETGLTGLWKWGQFEHSNCVCTVFCRVWK